MEAEKAAIEAKRVAQVPTPIPVPVRPPAARLDPAEAEKQRLSRMTSAELAEEIRRRQLPSVDSLIEQDRQVMASTAKRRELHKQQEAVKAFVRKAEQAVDAWREKHPLKVKMHDAGMFRSAELLQLEQQAEQSQQALKTLQAKSRSVSEQDQQLRRQARSRVIVAQSDDREELEKLLQTDPQEFLRLYKNVTDNIRRYECYLKRADRQNKRTQDKENLRRHRERESLFKAILQKLNSK